jgi:hypothetical protein
LSVGQLFLASVCRQAKAEEKEAEEKGAGL